MIVEAQVHIDGSKAAVWGAIADIENSGAIIRGIQKIEVVERPGKGLVGLRWRETRLLFGDAATAEKWITEAVEQEFYKTRAEDGGFVFLSTMRVTPDADGVTLSTAHESRPQGVAARLFKLPMVFLFRRTIRKALLADLNDIKAAVEKAPAAVAQKRASAPKRVSKKSATK